MSAARLVPVEKRDIFLQRIAAMLALRGRGRFTDTDVADVAQLAMAGLIQDGRQRGVTSRCTRNPKITDTARTRTRLARRILEMLI
jgi:hypothetical protein